MVLHPGAYHSDFKYLVTENKIDGKICIRKFELVEPTSEITQQELEKSHSTEDAKSLIARVEHQRKFDMPVMLDELKPGFNSFEMVWTRDCTIETYQVLKASSLASKQSQDSSI